MKDKIEIVFELMKKGNKSPYYRLEDKFGLFISLYIKDIIEKCETKNGEKLNIDLGVDFEIEENIFAEFPLSYPIDNQVGYGNADFAVFYKENNKIKVCLIELKTNERTSTRKEHIEDQNNIYSYYQKHGTRYAIEQILNREGRQRQKAKKDKYKFLENRIKEIVKKYKLWENTENIELDVFDDSNIEIIYICGEKFCEKYLIKENEDTSNFKIISYSEIYKKIFENCDNSDIINKKMKELLENIDDTIKDNNNENNNT